MLVPVPTDHPFAGIAVKLQRADENIYNLGAEILRFFQECKYPVVPNPDDERWQDAVDYHRSLAIPKRFSVLAGEIVHHWRSCLDHVVWVFSDAHVREQHENSIQFPILKKPPNAKALERFEGQIRCIPKQSPVRKIISDLQPYKFGTDAIDHPLGIIHDMDRFDKHRELVIVHSVANIVLPADTPLEIVAAATAYSNGKTTTEAERVAIAKALNKQGKVLPQVAFAKFGKREHQFVVPSLQKLSGDIEMVMASFMPFL